MKSKTIHRLKIFLLGCFLSHSISLQGSEPHTNVARPLVLALTSGQNLFSFNQETKQYACALCKKETKTSGHMKIHMVVHNPHRPYRCGYHDPQGKQCTYSAKRRDACERHEIEYHSDRKPHICSTCNTPFKRKTHLESHKKIHTKKSHRKEVMEDDASDDKEVLDDQEDSVDEVDDKDHESCAPSSTITTRSRTLLQNAKKNDSFCETVPLKQEISKEINRSSTPVPNQVLSELFPSPLRPARRLSIEEIEALLT